LNLRRRGRLSYFLAASALVCGIAVLRNGPVMLRGGPWAAVPNVVLLRWGVDDLGGGAKQEVLRRLSADELDANDRGLLLSTCQGLLRPTSSRSDQLRGLDLAVLLRSKDERAWEVVLGAMRHSWPRIQIDAIQSVNIYDDECPMLIVDGLCDVLADDPNPDARIAALQQLMPARRGKDSRVATALLRAMRSSDRAVALRVATVWRDVRMDSSVVLLDGLKEMSGDPDPWTSRLAKYAISNNRALRRQLAEELSKAQPSP
jgi:hypothetical protein